MSARTTETEMSYKYKSLCVGAEMAISIFDDFRIGADMHLEATLAAPSKWTELRWRSFHAFCTILTNPDECGVEATEADIKALKRIARDETEPNLFRARALDALGQLRKAAGDIEETAYLFRCGVDMINAVTPWERNRATLSAVKNQKILVGSILDQMLDLLEKNIRILEHPFFYSRYKMNEVPKIDGKPDMSIVKRLGVGGSCCDHCGKSHSDVKGEMFRCSCCKKAYYCSEACARRQWKTGHKEACRAPDQIEVDDYVEVRGLVSRPELNSAVGRVVRQVPGGRFEVSIDGRRKTISVLPEKLVHLRPAK